MFVFILLFVLKIHFIKSSIRTIDDCQLLIVVGTTSSFGAVISASKFVNARTCLLEPTDWVGGQLREGPPEDHPTISERRREKNFFFRFYYLK
jgi:hypothetical protein